MERNAALQVPEENRKTGPILFFAAAALYLAGLAVYVFWSHQAVRKHMISHLDEQLRIAVETVPLILGEDFHDRATGPGAISGAEILRNTDRLQGFAGHIGCAYLYTVVEEDGNFFLTASSAMEDVPENNQPSGYLEYENPPEMIRRAFESEEPFIAASSSDQYGGLRGIVRPFRSPGGRVFVAGAGFHMDTVNGILKSNYLFSICTGLFFLFLFIPMLLLYRHSRRVYITRLREKVAEQEEIEQSLRKNEFFFRALTEHSSDVTLILDSTGHYCYASQSSRIAGYEPVEVIGHGPGDFVHPEAMPIIEERILRARENPGEIINLPPFQVRRRDGAWIYFDGVISSIPELPDIDDAIVVNCRDVTERMEAEQQLRESEKQFRTMVEQAPFSIQIFDTTGRTIQVNAAFENLWGVPLEALKEYNILEDAQLEKNGVLDDIRGAFEGRPAHFSATLYDGSVNVAGGCKRWTEARIYPVFDSQGDIRTVILMHEDITEKKEAEAEREKLEAQIRQAQKLESLGVLAGGIAHDFNNLLMGILGNIDMALVELSPLSPARQSIKNIETAAHRAADLCRQMLAYSGKGNFVIEPVNLNEIIHEMNHLLAVSIAKNALLKFHLHDPLPAVEGDPTQLHQIVMNLVINASEAIGSKSGIITVSTGVMDCSAEYLSNTFINEELASGRYVYLEVSDTGCGMSPEIQERIFEPFFTTKFTGRGLGMAAVIGIVRGHNGAMKIYSEEGRGSTFKILLPTSETALKSEISERESIDGWRGKGLILLIDDEPVVREVGLQLLEYHGFTVLTAEDGRAGLELFRRHAGEIACVFLDLTMPHMSGQEVYREIHQISPETPVILMSGYNEKEATGQFAGKGLAGFLQKPFQREKLVQTLRNTLET
jgi:two-component system, cell cycle sensor histidine kinase and response regulator CckA